MACVSLLKGDLTNEKNKTRNTFCSAPRLPPVLVSLTLSLPNSIAQADYLPFCFPSQILGSAPKGFESLYGMGPSPLPPSREAVQAGTGGAAPVLHLGACWLSRRRGRGDSELCWSWV